MRPGRTTPAEASTTRADPRAAWGSTRTIPYLSALNRATSGYVWFLPVTTAPAKALGTREM
jgi:hypothetical protein